MNLECDWLKRWNSYAPNTKALTNGDTGHSLSYAEFFEQACAGAAFLKQTYNLKPGDRVLHYSTNEPASLVLYFACNRLGVTLAPINFRLTAPEITYLINNCDPQLIVFEEAFHKTLTEIKNVIQVPEKNWLVLTGAKVDSFESKVLENCKNKNFFHDFLSSQSTIAQIIYTSGTTGFPKGAMISHSAIMWNSWNTTLRLNIMQKDSVVIFLPLFHTGGWNVLTTPLFHRGGHVILTKKFDADQVLRLSQEHQCTLMFGVPTTMMMMSNSKRFSDTNLTHMRYAIVGGEAMPLEQIRTWADRHIPIRQGFGLTEFGPGVFSLNEEDAIRKMGSIGFPNFYVETKIVDDNNNEVGTNEIGELWLKGPACMSGYWKNEKATQDSFSGEWLKTGDLVRYDDEGYFYVVGRKKEMFKSGGENVYPAEIEKVIQQLPWVAEVAVIGVKNPQWGEVGHAFVVAKEFDQYNLEDLQKHCEKNLAKFKNPKIYTQMKELPKGDSGKILKRKLTEETHV